MRRKRSSKTVKPRDKFNNKFSQHVSPSKGGLSYEQVRALSLEYRLPSKIIYQLNSEYSILMDAIKQDKMNEPPDYE